ncbi:MAG: hypothetical protein DHS20C13_29370 [Thermodesulfobacteriota bacterium]|nr:MAG: hypothetical protein DHS20C13_29370 [Thermodesulfobacteriota bacterium]GJM36623.1 MAG: hypothetical protein DHS20C18_56240 [Saprospiraceae bacterium]
MKNLYLLLVFGLLLSSCVDPCESTTCLNGGICENGDCFCIDGFAGDNCEIPPCQVNQTGILCVKNSSATDQDHDVLIDGVKVATLSPGEEHCKTVLVGEHSVRSYFAGTMNPACGEANPTIIQCGVEGIECGA